MSLVTIPWDVLISVSCCLAYAIAAGRFCNQFLETSKAKEKLFILTYFSGIMAFMAVYEHCKLPYIVYGLSEHLFFLGMTALLFQSEMEKKLLTASILIAVRTLVWGFGQSFFSCIVLVILHVVKGEMEPVIGIWEEYVIICLTFATGIWVIGLLSKYLKSVLDGKMRRWYALLTPPLLAIVMIADIWGWGATYGIMVRGRDEWNLYYNQIFSHVGNCVFTALSMFAVGFYVFGMNKIYVEQKKMGQYQSQIAAYKMLEEQYGRMERLRHDMKNHIIGLQGLLADRDMEKMEQYLRQMQKAGDIEPGEEATGNKVVDALLYQNRKQAEKKKILWECHVQIPKSCSIDEMDLCVLFGNLLDNALEACERLSENEKRFINIQAQLVKRCFLLEVKNSSGLPEAVKMGTTLKENPDEHGIGLGNIKDVVQKYGGVMDMEVKKNVFLISILLPLKNAVHDMEQTV